VVTAFFYHKFLFYHKDTKAQRILKAC
jgi:hypothetical protein